MLPRGTTYGGRPCSLRCARPRPSNPCSLRCARARDLRSLGAIARSDHDLLVPRQRASSYFSGPLVQNANTPTGLVSRSRAAFSATSRAAIRPTARARGAVLPSRPSRETQFPVRILTVRILTVRILTADPRSRRRVRRSTQNASVLAQADHDRPKRH